MAYPTQVSCPPTTNALSNQQRSQLRRTTQKLGRILGTTPTLLEEKEEMPLQLPLNLQRLAVPLHVQLSSAYSDDDALVRYPSTTSHKSRRSIESDKPSDPWCRPPSDRPYMRIANPTPHSPPAHGPYSPPPPYSAQPHHTSYTIPATRMPPSSPPAFGPVPSANYQRRQKMDKLRRTLGDGVPLAMVFPDRSSSEDSPLSSSSEEDLPARVQQHRIRR
ncbi:hypothetical protein MIND_00171300 [Mycena indigotica]|uniref:Uncharacterized protein n=1 Tax=Mycena indigotica TaxID=2126181 RepID=A0A8H6TFQ6_9AGAR|nr:uncharacterized protein MIND_00171300 [Mycena indigotica]KAF7316521.1 hypothetical protein MIND_00171300 [Mycena indigotica]